MRWLKQVLRQVNYFCQYCIVKALQVRTRKNIWCEQDLKWPQGCFSSILVIRLDEIGDMVMMSPFLRELRQNYPSAHITLVVNPIVYNLVELCPYVNKVLCFSRIGGRFSFYVNLWRGGVFSYRYLKKEDYELRLFHALMMMQAMEQVCWRSFLELRSVLVTVNVYYPIK